MPRFLSCFSSSAEISSSSFGTARGSISRIVVSVPKVLKMEANSTPTAPAPMTIIDFGCFFSSSTLTLVSTCSPSSSSPGNKRAAEPVARMMALALMDCFLPQALLRDHLALALHHFLPVERGARNLDAELARPLDVVVDFRLEEQGFGGDAAHVQASAAELGVLFDERGLQAVLGGAEGGGVAARAAADDRYVIRAVCHRSPPQGNTRRGHQGKTSLYQPSCRGARGGGTSQRKNNNDSPQRTQRAQRDAARVNSSGRT